MSIKAGAVLRKKHENMAIPELTGKVTLLKRKIRSLKKKLARKVSSENGDVVI